MIEQKIRKILDLPQSTANVEEGPLIDFGPNGLRLRYAVEGYEYPNGKESPVWAPVWTTVTFTGFASSMAFSFTPESSATTFMVEAFNSVCEVENSAWLKELRERAKAAHEEMPDSHQHYMLFIDHHGCLEVIAESVEVGDE